MKPTKRFLSPEDIQTQTENALNDLILYQKCQPLRSLKSFLTKNALTKYVRSKRSPDTTIFAPQGGMYALPEAEVMTMFGYLEAARREGAVAHYSERQGTPAAPECGIMLDYDLVVGSPDVKLSDKNVFRLAGCIARHLAADLDFPQEALSGKELSVKVFSIVKPAPVEIAGAEGTSGVQYKYGFHLIIPGVRVTRDYKKFLIQKLAGAAEITKLLQGDLHVLGDPADCLDRNSASVPVMFLGSCAPTKSTCYVLGPAAEVTLADEFMPMVSGLDVAELEKKYNMVAELSVCFDAKYPECVPAAPVKQEPLVKSHVFPCKPSVQARVNDVAAKTQNGRQSEEDILLAERTLSSLTVHDPHAGYLHQILNLLDQSYATDRNKWRNVVFALANTSDAYKPLAEWFSQKYEKWGDGTSKRLDSFDSMWEEAVAQRGSKKRVFTERSLVHWAKTCNPEQFQRVARQNYYSILARYAYSYGGQIEHYMVAKVLHAMLKNKFVTDVEESGRGQGHTWYEFVVPGQSSNFGEVWKWRREVTPDELQVYISERLPEVYRLVATSIQEQKNKAANEDEVKAFSVIEKAFKSSERRLFVDNYKTGVIKQAAPMFRRRGFAESLDKEPALFGVGNGVLRLRTQCRLINYFHEFPVMRFSPVVYRPFDPANPWTRLMLDAIADILPEPDVRDWIMFFAASSLAGGVKEGILLLWKGGGANGKTFFMRMVAQVMGHYAKKLNIAVLTSERESADKPNSAIMQLKNLRFGYVEETQKAEPLNTQRLKEIVNPGDISGRDLNKTQETFEVTANLMVGQNYDFVIDTTDHGTWRRLRYHQSKVKFCANPDPRNPYEKKDNPKFIREYIKDPDCQTAFLSIMVHYYERLQREYGGEIKRVPCPTLTRETEAFRNSRDTLNRYICECIVKSPNHPHTYQLADVSNRYAEWYSANIDRRRHIASETIQDIENSALQPFLHLAPNKQKVLRGCRFLSGDSRVPEPDESFFGNKLLKDALRGTHKKLEAPRKEWWLPAGLLRAPAGAQPSGLGSSSEKVSLGSLFSGSARRGSELHNHETRLSNLHNRGTRLSNLRGGSLLDDDRDFLHKSSTSIDSSQEALSIDDVFDELMSSSQETFDIYDMI